MGDGELKFGLLLQPWYVYDSSPRGTSTSYLRNVTGYSTFVLRRAEIKLSGKITPSWGFEVMVDPAKTQSFTASGVAVTDDKVLQDLAVTFLGVKGQEFSLGQKKIPITEEGLRGSSQLDFVERARITRAFSDRRETGLFYKGEFGKYVGAYASLTNGTPSNVVNYDKALFGAARVDVKPMAGLLVGASGGQTVGGSVNEIQRDIVNGFFKYTNIAGMPLGFEAEYLSATTGQTGKPTVKGDGYYATVNYTIATKYQFAVRYDFIDRNKDVAGNQVKTWIGGFNYLIKGNNVKLVSRLLRRRRAGAHGQRRSQREVPPGGLPDPDRLLGSSRPATHGVVPHPRLRPGVSLLQWNEIRVPPVRLKSAGRKPGRWSFERLEGNLHPALPG